MESGSFEVPSGACVLGGESHRELLAALPATTIQHLSAPASSHALTKTMSADAALISGAIRGLTHDDSSNLYEIRKSDRARALKVMPPLRYVNSCRLESVWARGYCWLLVDFEPSRVYLRVP